MIQGVVILDFYVHYPIPGQEFICSTYTLSKKQGRARLSTAGLSTLSWAWNIWIRATCSKKSKQNINSLVELIERAHNYYYTGSSALII
jgi:hypothetical protein